MISNLNKQLAGIQPWGNDEVNWTHLGLNFNSVPCESNTAIIVTSWYGQLMWLRSVLTQYRLTGKFVVCAYDIPFNTWSDGTYNKYLPTFKMWLLAHAWTFKHITYDSDKRNGWIWDIIYGAGAIRQFSNFEYVFTVNGDCIWECPEGVDQIIDLLGDADIMSVSSSTILHTCTVVYKASAFYNIVDYFLENIRTPVVGSRSPEELLFEAVQILGLQEKKVPNQPLELDSSSVDHYSRYNQNSTWKEIVGYRNLSAEHLTASVERLEPVDPKYLDLEYSDSFFSGHEKILLDYYKTKDRRYLWQFWDQGEDSWYDRVYHSLGYYGKEPVYVRQEWEG